MYYIVCLCTSNVARTADWNKARKFAECEDYIVIDTFNHLVKFDDSYTVVENLDES